MPRRHVTDEHHACAKVQKMNILVTADINWGIAKDRQPLVSIPADLKYFREVTAGGAVVMGRRTMERFPGGRVLPGRTNIVLSDKPVSRPGQAIICTDLKQLLEELKQYDPDSVYVIGGEQVYRQMLPYCNTVHVTRVNHAYDADTWFPNLDEDPDWELTGDSEEQTYFNLEYRYLRYQKRA